jgi:NitT/TauT family transport system permease protein
VLAGLAAALLFLQPAAQGEGAPTTAFWLMLAALAGAALWTIRRVASINGTRFDGVLTAALFGLWVLYFWQMLVVAFEVPRVLLPAPTLIVQSLIDNPGKLWATTSADRAQGGVRGLAAGQRPGFWRGFGD